MSFEDKMTVEDKVNGFSDQLQKLPTNMRMFSFYLRSLYGENAVGSFANHATGIVKIRDQTRQDAIVYVKRVLPLSTQMISYIKEFFEYYKGLELEEWKQFLPDILEEVTGYQQCCAEVVRMHEEMMVPLKKRQDEAKVLISELTNLNEGFVDMKEMLEGLAAISKELASVLRISPTASPLFSEIKEAVLAKAVADGQQVNINGSAIIVIYKYLIPALSAFLDGLTDVAGFFNIMKKELTSFQSTEERAGEEIKRIHYIMMKQKAMEVKRSCKEFYAVLPGVSSDLQGIPEEPEDLNYVDKWLIKQQEEIKKKYPQKITDQLRKLLMECESTEGFQQLATE